VVTWLPKLDFPLIKCNSAARPNCTLSRADLEYLQGVCFYRMMANSIARGVTCLKNLKASEVSKIPIIAFVTTESYAYQNLSEEMIHNYFSRFGNVEDVRFTKVSF
jgi:hypothetical protein